jgi:hypothetical protein
MASSTPQDAATPTDAQPDKPRAPRKASPKATPPPNKSNPKVTPKDEPQLRRDQAAAVAVKLAAVKPSDVFRMRRPGGRQMWVGSLVKADARKKELTIQVKWIKEPITVPLADVKDAAARVDGSRTFVPVRLR